MNRDRWKKMRVSWPGKLKFVGEAMVRVITGSVPWLFLVALAGCAAPRATAPPVAPSSEAVDARPGAGAASPALPVAEAPQEGETSFLSLLVEDPALAAATADLEKAPQAGRPAALLRRAREACSGAVKIHAAQRSPFGTSGVVEHERLLAYFGLALRDLDELLEAYPRSPEAPEAMFTVGRIHDYPYLNRFDEALKFYRSTTERYPGSPWAAKASERIALIERMSGLGGGNRHGFPEPEPAKR
jgi:hypothetical protein